jgi:hypothetical protein
MHNLLSMIATVPLDIADGTGITGTLNRLIGEVGTLAKLAGSAAAVAIVVVIAIIKRTMAAIISAAVMGFVIVFLVTGGLIWGGKKVGEDLNNGAPAPATVDVVSRTEI